VISVLIPNKHEENVREFVDKIAETLPIAQIIVANDLKSKGKGWALREALKEAIGDKIVFLDADGDIKPGMLYRLLPFLDVYDIVVGSKILRNVPLHRKIITWLSRIYVRLVFGLSIDTQTGIKIFKREVLTDWETNGFGFAIEILWKAKRKGYSMIEIPVEANIKAKMSLWIVVRTFFETIRILFSWEKY
tara:strand:+ start:116 stop:688 length:573 start_codon:yes stop_codon:yes gene_type:complete